MVQEDYVSFETAKLLKEKGFDNEVKSFYGYDSEFKTWELEEDDRWDTPNNWGSYYCSAPTLQMAMKWLREVHNIVICTCAYYSDDPHELSHRNNKPYWKIRIMNHIYSRDYDSFNTYEDACESAIKYCLENLI